MLLSNYCPERTQSGVATPESIGSLPGLRIVRITRNPAGWVETLGDKILRIGPPGTHMTGDTEGGSDPDEPASSEEAGSDTTDGNSDEILEERADEPPVGRSNEGSDASTVDGSDERKQARERPSRDDETMGRGKGSGAPGENPTTEEDRFDTPTGEPMPDDTEASSEAAGPSRRTRFKPHVSVTLEGDYDAVFERLEHPQALTHSELDSIVDEIEETLLAVLRTGGGIRSEIYNAANFELDEPWEIRIYLEALAMHDLVRLQDDRWIPSDYFK